MTDKSASVSEQNAVVARTPGALATNSAWDALGDTIAAEEAEKAKNKPVPMDPPAFAASVLAAAGQKRR